MEKRRFVFLGFSITKKFILVGKNTARRAIAPLSFGDGEESPNSTGQSTS
jgi:hypothetical protein